MDAPGLCTHSLPTTAAATNALNHETDIAKVQKWLGRADLVTTCLYAWRLTQPEDRLTFQLVC